MTADWALASAGATTAGDGSALGSSLGDGRRRMSDIWLILLGLTVAFVVGGLLGYRLGVIAGYDRAEEMLEQITAEQYRKLKQAAQEVQRDQ